MLVFREYFCTYQIIDTLRLSRNVRSMNESRNVRSMKMKDSCKGKVLFKLSFEQNFFFQIWLSDISYANAIYQIV